MRNLNIILCKNILSKFFICIILLFSGGMRFFVYLQNRAFWRDECALALNIQDICSLGQLFAPLNYDQCAPLFFVLLTKIMSLFFGCSELVLRFLPFSLSVVSIFLFYYITNNIFKNKFALIAANLLFALNAPLIYYSQEFKQYGIDVFVYLLSLIIFSKLEIQKYSVKKAFLSGVLAFLPFLMSYSYVFILGAYLFLEILKSKNKLNKSFYMFFVPLVFVFILYSIFVLFPSRAAMLETNPQYWQNGFMISLCAAINIFVDNLKYYFAPNNLILFMIVLFLFGVVHIFKNINKKIYLLILLSIILGFLASILHIYPFMKRTALWLLPSLIIIITAVFDFDFTKSKKLFSAFLFFLVLFIFSFFGYFGDYLKNFFKGGVYSIVTFFHSNEDARYGLELIRRNLNIQNKEILVLNSASVVEYKYYTECSNFKVENVIVIEAEKYSKEFYFKKLNKSLKKGVTYLFYFPYDYANAKVSQFLNEWILRNANKIYFIEKFDRSYFAKILY